MIKHDKVRVYWDPGKKKKLIGIGELLKHTKMITGCDLEVWEVSVNNKIRTLVVDPEDLIDDNTNCQDNIQSEDKH